MGKISNLMKKIKKIKSKAGVSKTPLSKPQRAGKTLGDMTSKLRARKSAADAENLVQQKKKVQQLYGGLPIQKQMEYEKALQPAPTRSKVQSQVGRYEGRADGQGKVQRVTAEGKEYIKSRPDLAYPDKYTRTWGGDVVNKRTGKTRRNLHV